MGKEMSVEELIEAFVERTNDPKQAKTCAARSMYRHLRMEPTEGWFVGECVVMDSLRLGERTILPFGPNWTHRTDPSLYSPRGLASDISSVIGVHHVADPDEVARLLREKFSVGDD